MKPSQIVKRADALYFGIAIAVTVLELAVIATTPALGSFALEYAFILQLVISVLIEFGAALTLVSRLGVVRACKAGFYFKTFSGAFFFAGVFIAPVLFWEGWALIGLSFVFDAIGTGVLRGSFRPAYSALHFDRTGRPAEFLGILHGAQHLRIGLPCAVLFLAYLVHRLFTETVVIVLLFLIVAMCRGAQLLLATRDLKGVVRVGSFKKMEHLTGGLSWLKAQPVALTLYIAGTVMESVVLMYGVGLIYRYREWMGLSAEVSWLGASTVSIALYIFSYLVAAGMVRRWSTVRYPLSAQLIALFGVCVMCAVLVFRSLDGLYVGALIALCFASSLGAIVMTRHASNQILEKLDEHDSGVVLVWAELLANIVLIAIAGLGVALADPQAIMRVFAIAILVLLVVAAVVACKGKLARIAGQG